MPSVKINGNVNISGLVSGIDIGLPSFISKISATIDDEDVTALSVSANSGSSKTLFYSAGSTRTFSLMVVIPSVAGHLGWFNGAADNGTVYLAAGKPFILPGKTTAYSATIDGRATATVENIDTVYFRQTTGAAARVDLLIVGDVQS